MTLIDMGWTDFFNNQINKNEIEIGQIGRVVNVQKGKHLVTTEYGDKWCQLSGKYSYTLADSESYPAVGDWVEIKSQQESSEGIILRCLDRLNQISRAAAGSHHQESGKAVDRQIIAANIDVVFIVVGLDRDYNLRRIERYLTLVYDCGASPVIVLNKADLCEDPESVLQEVEEIAIGVPVYQISAQFEFDPEPFLMHLKAGKTGALLGSSGAGKSTIINGLLGFEKQTVSHVSQQVGKGRHTTTTRELIRLPNGGLLIDNPGIRELQLISDEEALEKAFNEIERLAEQCRFSDCNHESEPGCAVKAAIDVGELDPDRLNSYRKLKREINLQVLKESQGVKYVEREKNKKIRLLSKEIKKIKQKKGMY